MDNQTVRDIEQDLIAYRKAPRYPGKTYTEVKAERARRWRAVKQAALVLGVLALMVAMAVLR